MEEQVNRLVEKTRAKLATLAADQRLLIAIAGIPGSGKTTLATTIVTRLNAATTSSTAAYVPMDGYHLTRAQLDALPDPTSAHARRGAAFTFDAASLHDLVRALRAPLTPDTPTYTAPSFSHALKDPIAHAISITPHARIVVFEGNYLALDRVPWREIAALCDERWFVTVEFDVAARRLVRRHLRAGLARHEDEAWSRVRENDLVNGAEIVEFRLPVHEFIESRECESFVGVDG